MNIELAKIKLKWGKENNDLKKLIKWDTQKKEAIEIRAMITKNKAKQNKEKEEIQLKMVKAKNKLVHQRKELNEELSKRKLKQEQEQAHMKRMTVELQKRNAEEIEEINLFVPSLKINHEREKTELDLLKAKQIKKIQAEEMYCRIMAQKQRWKSADVDMARYSFKKQTSSESRNLKYKKLHETFRDKWSVSDVQILDHKSK